MKIFFLIIPFFSFSQKKKLEWRGLYTGCQTITQVKKINYSSSLYAIALVGKGKITFNTQIIFPIPAQTTLIKFGIDYKVL